MHLLTWFKQSKLRLPALLTLASLGTALTGLLATATVAQTPNVIRTQTFTSRTIDSRLGTINLSPLPSPVFVYNKIRPTSVLRVTYQDTVANRGPGASTCVYQVRVNNLPSIPAQTFSTPILVVSNLTNTSLSSTGIFRGLPAGPVRINIWQRQVGATQCIRNSGGFVTTIIVEEFLPF